MSANPPDRCRTVVLLQMSDPLDMEAYAMRLKEEPRLVVQTDRRAASRPDLRLSDHCDGRAEEVPTLILTRSRDHRGEARCECCQRTSAGIRWPAFLEQLYGVIGRTPPPASLDCTPEQIDRLTPRERDVLCLVGQGKTVAQCAEAMGVASSTIGNHKYRLMRKLGASNSLQLLRIAVRNGLADFE